MRDRTVALSCTAYAWALRRPTYRFLNELADRAGNAERTLHVLALNSGSSSLKSGLYRARAAQATRLVSGEAEGVGEPESVFQATDAGGHTLLHETVESDGQRDALERIGELLRASSIGVDADVTETGDECGSSGALQARCRVLPSLEDGQIPLHACALGHAPDRASPATPAPPAAGSLP